MTCKELRELLAQAPDDMTVMISIEDHLHPGMFAFASPCPDETGVSTLMPTIDGEPGEDVFLILPHGFGVTEETENGGDAIPELN